MRPLAKLRSRICLALLASGLLGCAERTPIQIGFVAGVSGRVADLGTAGRNGAILAVEQRNRAGGVNGRQVELLIRDDEQNPETARRVVSELIERKVAAIVGNMTSSMCEVSYPLINAAKIVMVSPTCTATQFSGQDDYFLRAIQSTGAYAQKAAEHQFEVMQRRKVAAIFDIGNRAYTESWLNDFRERFRGLGGEMAIELEMKSSADAPFPELVSQLLSSNPDFILIITNSVDAAMLAQHLHKGGSKIPIVTSEWAATERLIELGGEAVEGLLVAQFIDRQSTSPEYHAFVTAYRERFNHEPGFGGVLGYDATRVVMDGLGVQAAGQPLKDTILATRQFSGAGGKVEFNEYGDAVRPTYLTRIHAGQYETLD